MSLESDLSELNEFYFFREFTYSKNLVRLNDGQEIEVADNILALDDIQIIFQLKERSEPELSTPETEVKWYKKKIITAATKQIRDTVNYLKNCDEVVLSNNRGHRFNIEISEFENIHKIVVYQPSEKLSIECKRKKCHISRSVGIIHLFLWNDYLMILRILVTPAEVYEYLTFRSSLIKKWGEVLNAISESALLGQYISGYEQDYPCEEYKLKLVNLDNDIKNWDMSGVINKFPQRMQNFELETDYYFIISEFAKLVRSELREVKKIFQISMDDAEENKFKIPYRFASLRTGSGFLFLPLDLEIASERRKLLKAFALIHKYELKLQRVIAASFLYRGDGWFDNDWFYYDRKWERNEVLEDLLKNDNPLNSFSMQRFLRYKYL